MGKYETLVKGSKDERIEQSLLSNPFRVVKRNYKQTERSENRMNYSFSQREREEDGRSNGVESGDSKQRS